MASCPHCGETTRRGKTPAQDCLNSFHGGWVAGLRYAMDMLKSDHPAAAEFLQRSLDLEADRG